MKQTTLYKSHQKHGAKLVEFAGFAMPIQYESIIAEHKAVRNTVGIFDVSHMGEVFIRGEKALDFVQHITVNDASKLFDGRVQYSAMCYEDGGIVDDLLVYKISDTEYMLVINASNIEKDVEWMNSNNSFGVTVSNESDEYSLIAVQGPESRNLVEKLFGKAFPMEYYHFTYAEYGGNKMIVSRTGYTGELGYEIYFKGDDDFANSLWDAVFEAGKDLGVKPAGLGCRDSLRLEMGYCLYGNDIDAGTNPLEAGLGWITKLGKENFIGKEAILRSRQQGLGRKLTPLIADSRVFPRHGYDVMCGDEKAGVVTSGTLSPMLDKGIALAYVDSKFLDGEHQLSFSIRNTAIPARIVTLPFIQK